VLDTTIHPAFLRSKFMKHLPIELAMRAANILLSKYNLPSSMQQFPMP
jgi:hypothetical protein